MNEALTLDACRLCPRLCGADRRAGRTGWCGAGALARVARAAPHYWEEPCLSGSRGSGTVFFSRCNMHCLYCQNHEISRGGEGRDVTPETLASIFLRLQAEGVHNINLVSPTPYIPQIATALKLARQRGLSLPVVYNTNAYERPEALLMLKDLVQIFLPDLKYADNRLGEEYSGTRDYYAAATAAIKAMRALAPEDRFDGEGLLVSGLLVRHLVLPGQPGNTQAVLRWLAAEIGAKTYISLMAQYTPVHLAAAHLTLGRGLTRDEYEQALEAFTEAGLENGFCQELASASSAYTPDFNWADLPG